MIQNLLISAMVMIAPMVPCRHVPAFPKQYAVLSYEKDEKVETRRERRSYKKQK